MAVKLAHCKLVRTLNREVVLEYCLIALSEPMQLEHGVMSLGDPSLEHGEAEYDNPMTSDQRISGSIPHRYTD